MKAKKKALCEAAQNARGNLSSRYFRRLGAGHAAFVAAVPFAYKPNVSPDKGKLPGMNQMEKLVSGVMGLAVLVCVAAIIWGTVQWLTGSKSQNYQNVSDGKSKILYGVAGAFVIGAAVAFVNYGLKLGKEVN